MPSDSPAADRVVRTGIGWPDAGGRLSARDVVRLLQLEPLPDEGGWFRRTHFDGASSAIYYLLSDELPNGGRSLMHRLPGPEIWHHYAGAAVDLLLLHGESRPVRLAEEFVLGSRLDLGEIPQVVVPGGSWQGGSTRGPWSLLGTTMAPAYRDEDFELGDRDALVAGWPSAAARIDQLAPDVIP